jgi:hypothetical protein
MLKSLPLLLAAVQDPLAGFRNAPADEAKASNLASTQMRDLMIIIGAALVTGLALFAWAYLTRRKRQHAMATHRGARVLYQGNQAPAGKQGKRRRHRGSDTERWRRNPTLAEAGGLPPLRPDDPEPAPPQSTEQAPAH